MRTKLFFLSALLLAMLGVCGCCGDDEWEEYAQNLDKEFEQIVVDENDDAEDWIGIASRLDGWYRIREGNGHAFRYATQRGCGLYFTTNLWPSFM